MEWVKRYWWIAILVLVLPVVMNRILQIPAFTHIVGDSESWLSFWGGYLGAIISAGVAFVILAIQYGQNKEENLRNRQLQINVIKHQQEQAWLHNIIEISAKLIYDTNLARISIVCGKIGGPNCDTVDMLEDIIKDVENHKSELDLYIDSNSRTSSVKFKLEIGEYILSFCCALNEISNIACFFIYNKGNVSIPTLKDYISKSERVSDEMSKLIIDYADSVDHALDYKHFYDIAIKGINLMTETQLNISKCIDKYISAEKGRIDKSLIESLS